MSRLLKPQARDSSGSNVVYGSSTRDFPHAEVATNLIAKPVQGAIVNPPHHLDDDFCCAVVLRVFDDVWAHRRSSSAAPFDADYKPSPEWGKVPGSPWRHKSFGAIAKAACGGGTTSTIQGPDWALSRKLISASKGLPLSEKMQLLVDSNLDSDVLIFTIASILDA